MPSLKSTFWSWTLNNYVETELDALRDRLRSETVRYAIFSKEVGKAGTPHLQGYIAFKKQTTFKQCKEILHETAHVEISKKGPTANIKYCSKEGSPEEFGQLIGSGSRSDLESFKACVKEGVFDKKRIYEEHSDVTAKYPRFINDYLALNIPVPEVEPHPLRPWQQDLYQALILPPDKRTICFVVDPEGNRGKTWFAQYYCSIHPSNSFILEPGKKADMAYALPLICRVLFINCTREQNDFLNYSFLESCKDGYVFSPKYESCIKRYPPMHVIVLMNQMPDDKKLSPDRYHIIKLP